MYVKDCKFYFDKNDYLHFDKLKFTACDSYIHTFTRGDYYDYGMDTVSLHADYGIHIDFYNALKSDKKIKLLITSNKHKNKMSLLYNLKRIMSLIYNSLLLCRQYVNIFEYNNKFDIILHLTDKEHNKNINLIEMRGLFMRFVANIDNQIKQNSAIIVSEQPDINRILLNRIVIENNIIRTNHATIIHFESCNRYYSKIMSRGINLCDCDDTFIAKKHGKIYISYYTPPSLLIKFIDNIELFDDFDVARINNAYDLLKYI